MKKARIPFIPNKNNGQEADLPREQLSEHLRRKAEALQDRRWRKINRQINRFTYLDNQVKNGGGIV